MGVRVGRIFTAGAIVAGLLATPFADPASGSIDGEAGSLDEISPPASVALGAIVNNNIRAFDEKQNFALTSDVTLEYRWFTGSPWSFPASTNPITLETGDTVDSHFVHFQRNSNGNTTGDVSFDHDIVGFMANQAGLDATDTLLGNAGTTYPTGVSTRGLEGGSSTDDTVTRLDDDDFRLRAKSNNLLDQVRIVTNEPDAPTCASSSGSPVVVNEGSLMTINGTGSDRDTFQDNTATNETVSSSVAVSDGLGGGSTSQGVTARGATAWDRSWAWTRTVADGTATTAALTNNVTVTTADSDAVTVNGTCVISARIVNVAPNAVFNVTPTTVPEGSAFTLSLTSPTDVPADVSAGFNYHFDCGVGGFNSFTATNSRVCTTNDDGTLTVQGEIRDKDQGVRNFTTTIGVTSVAPTATFNVVPSTLNEGSNFTLSLTGASDPSSVDTTAGFTYHFDCGDGLGFNAFSSTTSRGCTTNDNAVRTVKGEIRDVDGATTTYTSTANVNNVAPTGAFSSPASVNEGSTINLAITGGTDVSTVDAATLQYQFDCGDGGGFDTISSTSTRSCATADNGSWSVQGRIQDKDSGQTTYGASVTIVNVAPTATFNAPASVNEGSSFTLSLTSPVDVAADLPGLTYRFDCGSGFGAFGASSSVSCPTSDNGSLSVAGEIKDKDGGFTGYSGTVNVLNVAPTATFNAPASANEGSSFTLSLTSPVDVAADLPGLTYRFDCGSGFGAFGASSSVSCPTSDNGSLSVAGEIKDKDGGFTGYSGTVNVLNVAPTATFNAPASVNEGNSFTLSLTSPADVAADLPGLTYRFDCGSGFGAFSSTSSVSCPTTDSGSRNVAGEIKDKDGGVGGYLATVAVSNVAPTATFVPQSPVDEGTSFSLALASPSDPSSDDTTAGFAYRFDCGDGLGFTAWSSSTSASCPTTDNGPRLVAGEIQDKDGGSTLYTATVSVDNVSPVATFNSPASVAEGSPFSLSLTSPLDPSPADTTAGFTYRFNCGLGFGSFGSSSSTSCSTDDNETRSVQGEIQDKDFGFTGYAADVEVTNVAPEATFVVYDPVDEGTAIGLALTSPFDPSGADTTAGFSYRFDCGSGFGAWGSASTATCPTTDNGSRTVQGEIRDKDLGVSGYTATVTIANVAPTATFGYDDPVDEGSDIGLSLTGAFDPSSADTSAGFTYRFDCGTGSGFGPWTAASTAACPTTDNGPRTVQGEIRDKDLGANGYSATVTISNVAPTATFGYDDPVDEGSEIGLSLTGAVDPSSMDTAAGFEYRFDCGPGFGPWGPSSTAACPTNDDGSRTVKGEIRDKDGGTSSYTSTVTIANVAPTATLTVDNPVEEGSVINVALIGAYDPSSVDTGVGFDYRFDCGSGFGSWGPASSTTCPVDDNGTRTIKAEIRDKDGDVSSYQTDITVNNVAPAATFNYPVGVPEGTTISLSLTGASDPSSADTLAGFSYRFDCGDGDGFSAWGPSSSASCPTNDDGSRSVAAEIRDKDGGVSTYNATVPVANVAPTATFHAESPVSEGTGFTLSMALESDPSSVDTAAGFEYRFDCGDGSGLSAWDTQPSRFCASPDSGDRAVVGEIRDKDLDASSYSGSVTVTNVAPEASFLVENTADEGSSFSLDLTGVFDPSPADNAAGFEYRFDCGDGFGFGPWTSASGTSCATDDDGGRLVAGEIRDQDGGTSSYSGSVTVNNVAPTAVFDVESPVSEGSSFTLALSSPFDPSTIDTAAGFEYRFDCGDGSGFGAWSGSPGTTCATTGSDDRSVVGEIRDDDNGSTSYFGTVVVDNVAPTADFVVESPVSEGSSFALSLDNAFDPSSGDTTAGFEYRFDCGDGSGFGAWGASSSASCATTDNGIRSVAGEIRDQDLDGSSYTGSATVDNVAPTADFNAESPVDEGSSFALSMTNVVDPSIDDTTLGFEYRFDCGDGFGAWQSAPSTSCTTDDDDDHSVAGEVRDKDGGTSSYTATVTVANVAPTAHFSAESPVDEGSSFTLSLDNAFDPSSVDTAAGFEYRFDCGTGFGPWGSSSSTSCSTSDNGTRSVAGEVRDKDGGTSSYSSSVTVNNVAPTATFNVTSPVNEGSPFTLSLTGAFDPSSTDTAAGLQYRFDCGTGFGPWGSSSSASCSTNDNGTRAVAGQVRDKDGASSGYTGTVTINNVSPTATFNAPASVVATNPFTISLTSASDPSTVDTAAGFLYRFDCGDGGGYGAWGSASSRSCPTGTTPHTRTVLGQVRDKDLGVSSYQAQVVVVQRATTNIVANPAVASVALLSLKVTINNLQAKLLSNGVPVPGRTLYFYVGSTAICSASTNAQGIATCSGSLTGLLATILNLGYDVRFDGDNLYLPSTGHGPLVKVLGLKLF